MRKLAVDRLPALFAAIAAERALYLPVRRADSVRFAKWTGAEEAALDALPADLSPKELFFPQSETLMRFRTQGKAIELCEEPRADAPFAVFGLRACDAAALGVLDLVFLAPPADSFYQARRNAGVLITLACESPEATCFCPAFGIDAASPAGDVAVWLSDGALYWQPQTEKGEALTDAVSGALGAAFAQADGDDEAALSRRRDGIRAKLAKLPLRDFRPDSLRTRPLREVFSSPRWQELSQACIGCGTCTFVCPTCQCYDIRDYDTGHGVRRFRCWDSCMYSEFTKMAAGNPRTTQTERFRQRFMHKLVYFPENNGGVYACVGCGRCLRKCPVSMNIVRVAKAMREDGEKAPQGKEGGSDER